MEKIYKSTIPIVLVTSLELIGCNKKMDFQVEGKQVHKYITKSRFKTYKIVNIEIYKI